MSSVIITLVEWGATLLSLAGFWLCIRHRASCFVVFFIADLGWFASAWVNFHPSLLAQQIVYLLLNVVGYVLWRRDDRLRETLERLEARALKVDDDEEELLVP
jgi:nicotinamide riboside transporter PnuC